LYSSKNVNKCLALPSNLGAKFRDGSGIGTITGTTTFAIGSPLELFGVVVWDEVDDSVEGDEGVDSGLMDGVEDDVVGVGVSYRAPEGFGMLTWERVFREGASKPSKACCIWFALIRAADALVSFIRCVRGYSSKNWPGIDGDDSEVSDSSSEYVVKGMNEFAVLRRSPNL
jgi:hypothetical protein